VARGASDRLPCAASQENREAVARQPSSFNVVARRLAGGHLLYRGLQRTGLMHIERALCLTPDLMRRPIADSPRLRWEALAPGTLEREAGAGGGLAPADVAAALERGDWCVGVFDGADLVSHCWFTTRPARLCPGLAVRFDPAWAYGYWAFTRPDQRGRGLHALGKGHALDLAVARGLRGLLSAVRADNAPSLRSAARLGCRRVGSLVALGPPRRRWAWVTPGCRPYGLRLETT
jgi:GNAT superfamily N-acetyltransferase